ncbi:lipase family protein [Aurantivibrio plasticivorans]
MPKLTASEAANLASGVYQLRSKMPARAYAVTMRPLLPENFHFDFENEGRIEGISGSILKFNKKTGFAMAGTGTGPRSNEAVISIRGTEFTSTHDWLTNGQIGLKPASNKAMAHAGFNNAFNSISGAIQEFTNGLNGVKTIHCVGHSLGGAIATLCADWISENTAHNTILYTFGAPRVGLEDFAGRLTRNASLPQIYRTANSADPVPMVPLWPFMHAPLGGLEYRSNNTGIFDFSAHGMDANQGAKPGYIQAVSGRNWEEFAFRGGKYLNQSIQLQYNRRHETSFNKDGLEKITAALIALLKKAGYLALVQMQAALMAGLTFYDFLARTVAEIYKASENNEADVKGLLGHMLAFMGDLTTIIKEITYQTIKTIFDKLVAILNRMAHRAVQTFSK